jgi:hypothetical protein
MTISEKRLHFSVPPRSLFIQYMERIFRKTVSSSVNPSVDRTNIIMISSTHPPVGPMIRPVDHHLVRVDAVVLAVVVVVVIRQQHDPKVTMTK